MLLENCQIVIISVLSWETDVSANDVGNRILNLK